MRVSPVQINVSHAILITINVVLVLLINLERYQAQFVSVLSVITTTPVNCNVKVKK